MVAIMESQVEKNMENEMESTIQSLKFRVTPPPPGPPDFKILLGLVEVHRVLM